MDGKVTHRLVSAGIYYVAFFVLLFAVAVPTILISGYVEGGWGVLVAIIVFLVATGFALKAFDALRRWRADGFFRLSFPSYRGVRYPAFHLISALADDRLQSFSSPLGSNMIAESDDALFVLSAIRNDRPHEIAGGRILRHPVSGADWGIAREAMLSIDVLELTDEAIKAAAVDDTSYGERLVTEGLHKLMGVSAKRKIVPFAAFVVITAEARDAAAGGIERLTFAIPTEIHDDTMHAMGIGPRALNNELVDAAIRHAVRDIQHELAGEARDIVGDVTGEMPLEIADEIIDLKQEVDYWVNLGAAKIATTDGARGRTMARVIAERVRQWARLEAVQVTTLT